MSCSEKIMHSEHSNRVSRAFSLLPGVLAIMAGSFFGFAARLEAAEKYSELPGLQLSSEERKLARQYGKGDVDAGDRAAQTAFRKSVENELRRLTQLGEMARYGDIRKTIYNSYLAIYKPETKAARAVAIDRIVFYANGVAKSKSYSPQSRINFVALLAELDDQPRARAAPPLPAAAAFQPLYEIANSPAMPLYLRAVALHGLERQISVRWHAPGAAGWNDTQKQAVQKMLTDILASKPASALDYKSHQWVARRALDCLAAAESPAALDLALANLGDPESATNMRLTSANYLCQLDASTFTDEQKSSYLVGLAHFARSELVKWYEREDNILKRTSGASGYGGGGYGDYGGGGMGGYGDSGGGDFGAGGGMGGYSGGDGMGMDGYGGGYGSPSGNKKVKAVDTQTWQTILARRRANEICQAIRLCLSGSPAAETTNYKGKVGTVLADAQLPTEQQTLVDEFVTAVDTLQEAVNDVEAVTDVNKLLQGSMVPIEDIMDLVLDIPGFAEQYPDLMEGEELEAVPDAPAQPEAGEGDDPAAEGAEPAAGAEAAAEPAGN